MELLTSEQMRAADAHAIHKLKIPSLDLMEAAGECVARKASRILDELGSTGLVGVICGKGNNGGDGLVAARLLHENGCAVRVVLTSATLSPDAQANLDRLPRGLPVFHAVTPSAWRAALVELASCRILLDALFGTGLGKPLRGLYRRMVEDINMLDIPVLAVDIASGVNASTGAVMGAAVEAAWTVTFARAKVGHILYPGAAYTGKLDVDDIGIPDESVDATDCDRFLITPHVAAQWFPSREPDAHKGDFGRTVVIAGSVGMAGAAALVANGAAKSGSGLTVLLTPKRVWRVVAAQAIPEVMCRPVSDESGVFGEPSLADVLDVLRPTDAVVLGPGIGRAPRTVKFMHALLSALPAEQHVVIDADGLWALAAKKMKSFLPRAQAVLTPHAGELSRLTGVARERIAADPLAAGLSFTSHHACTLVLKGARTVVTDRAGIQLVNATGSVALAKGGTGDVLAGMIGGLLAQGMSPPSACGLAVYLHGRAADIAVERRKRSTLGFLASDILTFLDDAILELE